MSIYFEVVASTRREQRGLLELFGKLDWKVDYDYTAERSRAGAGIRAELQLFRDVRWCIRSSGQPRQRAATKYNLAFI
jgi:hypothetical protein